MAARRQVVAWLSKAEWEQVLEYLYSRDCKLQRDALHRISAWKSRYGNRMPLAVECTAELVRCKIMDLSGGMGNEELVFLYGLALVRFVNLITERKQKSVAIPLRRLAYELNIPEWVVNLRHEVTHGKLPKLNLCRKGWDCVMEWLRREYWSRQLGSSETSQWMEDEETLSEETEDVQPHLSFKEQKCQTMAARLRETLRSYIREQFKIFQDPKAKKPWNVTADLEFIIAQTKDLIRQSSAGIAAEILLEDGFLIPTAKQLAILKIDQEDIDKSLHLPRTLLHVWQPLLKALHSQDFTQELLEKMFSALGLCEMADSEQRVRYLSCWISEVLTANHRADRKSVVGSRNQAAVKSKWKLFPNRVVLKWRRLLQKSLESPCQATPLLLKLIFEYMKPGLPTDTQEKLLCLCSIYIQDDDDSDGSVDYSDQPIYTVESLEWRIKQESKGRANNTLGTSAMEEEYEQATSEPTEDEEMITQEYEDEYIEMINMKMATERRTVLQGSPWGVSTEYVQWGKYPLGLVPGQSEDPGCLLVDSYSVMSVLEQQGTETKKNGSCVSTSSPIANDATFEPVLWSQTELNNIKAGLQLF